MKLKEVLDRTTQFFKDKQIDTPRLDAEILLSHSLGIRRIDLYLKFDQPLSELELEKCRALVRRRITGEPVAYILGSKGFMGYDFMVDPSVLIPRPETELLVEATLEWVKSDLQKSSFNANSLGIDIAPIEILDLGSGSGCIGLSLVKFLKEKLSLSAHATLVDISAEALNVARKNSEVLGLLSQTTFVNENASNFMSNKKFQIVVANPPYIAKSDTNIQKSVVDFEPHLALFSEETGFHDLKTWSENASKLLDQTSFMGFEHGIGQSQEIKKHFRALGCFNEIKIIQDYSKIDRHVIGICRTNSKQISEVQ